MKKLYLLICTSILLLSINSCGVMFGGSKFKGTIVAVDHPTADIYVNGNRAGQGTVTGLYPRNKSLTVELKKEGCEPKTQNFEKTFRTGNFILSVITWGLLGIAVDLGTGAAYKPDHLDDPKIQKLGDKSFTFTVDYPGCPTNK